MYQMSDIYPPPKKFPNILLPREREREREKTIMILFPSNRKFIPRYSCSCPTPLQKKKMTPSTLVFPNHTHPL